MLSLTRLPAQAPISRMHMAGRCKGRDLTAHFRHCAQQRRAKQSKRADNLLSLLLLILALWCLSNCQSIRPTTEAHATKHEYADPHGWHESNSLDD